MPDLVMRRRRTSRGRRLFRRSTNCECATRICERRECRLGGAMALRSRTAIQRIDLGPGERLFDSGEVVVKQFLGLRAGDVHSSAID